jgi:hypothetical protein
MYTWIYNKKKNLCHKSLLIMLLIIYTMVFQVKWLNSQNRGINNTYLTRSQCAKLALDLLTISVKSSWSMSNFQNFVYNVQWGLCKIEIDLWYHIGGGNRRTRRKPYLNTINQTRLWFLYCLCLCCHRFCE